jgi:hypothetical protein
MTKIKRTRLYPYWKNLESPTVEELIKALKVFPSHFKVLVAVDEEENAVATQIGIKIYRKSAIIFLPLNPKQDL